MVSKDKRLIGRMRSSITMLVTGLALIAFVAPTAMAANVVINKLDDLNLGTWNGKKNLKRHTNHCVAADDEEFTIIITGDGPGGAFTVASGAALLPYRVFYKDQPDEDYIRVRSGVPIDDLEGGENPYKCKGQKQRLQVRIRARDLAMVPAGTYSGIITLMVYPY